MKRGYPETVIEKEMEKVRFFKQGQKPKKVKKGVSLLLPTTPYLIHCSL